MSPAVNRPNASGADHQAVCGTKNEPTSWVCIRCSVTKPVHEFAKNSWTRRGRRHVCQECRRTYDRMRDYIRRARKYGHIPAVEDFTQADLVERHGERCYHCDGPFECIDHLICVRVGGTHTRDNVVPCCLKCNGVKRRTVDEERIRAYRRKLGPAA
jgi:transposase-like protein